MSTEYFSVQKLPDIEMYGGDTTPWEIELMRDNNTIFKYEDGVSCTVVLTLTPLKASTGLGSNATVLAPILTKYGVVKSTATNGTSVIFVFAAKDTKDLRGKYTYQLEVKYENDCRIGQGTLYIKQNINR